MRIRRGGSVGRLDVRTQGAKAELHLELTLHGDLGHRLDAERRPQMKARLGRAVEGAEALHHRHFVRLDLVDAGDEENE